MLGFLIPAITAAAGFLGRNKGTIGKIAGAAAPILGGMAQGRQADRYREDDTRYRDDANRTRLYEAVTRNLMDRGQLGADKARFERDSPGMRLQQSVRGDLISGMPQGVQGRFSGAVGNIGPEARSAGSRLAQLASERMGQDSFELPNLPAPPQLSGPGKSNIADKILGFAGPATSLLSLIGRGSDDASQAQVEPRPLGQLGQLGDVGIDPDELSRRLRASAFGGAS